MDVSTTVNQTGVQRFYAVFPSVAPELEFRSLQIGEDGSAFRVLNEEWITRYFTLEAKDRETLEDPENAILRKGGRVILVYEGEQAVGCVALLHVGEGTYELSKMAVLPALRGRGIGRRLLAFTIEQAREMGAKQLSLGSSTKLPNAVHLYESLGFVHVPPERLPWMKYARSDVFMELALSKLAMQIRLASASDVPSLLEMLGNVVPRMREAGNLQWDETYPNGSVLHDDIAHKQLWVAEIDGTLGGLAAITMDQSPEYAQVGWDVNERAIVIHRLAVDPKFRGMGMAQGLMQKAEEVAEQRGIRKLRVDTNTRNEATQRLFPKLGYCLAGEISLGFRPGLRFLCYEKCLG